MRAYSQFPQPDLHRLDTRPYGLRTKDTKNEIRFKLQHPQLVEYKGVHLLIENKLIIELKSFVL
jgi:hypothetical protein